MPGDREVGDVGGRGKGVEGVETVGYSGQEGGAFCVECPIPTISVQLVGETAAILGKKNGMGGWRGGGWRFTETKRRQPYAIKANV